MSDYIDREELLKAQFCAEEYNKKTGDWDLPVVAVDDIKAMPAADVAPVRRGKPILKRGLARCSECDGQTSLVWPYCPHCGAKMENAENIGAR